MIRPRGRLIGLAIAVFICVFPTALEALTLTLSWDPSTGTSITGYFVSYGTQSGVYTQRLDVGNQTSQSFSTLVDGQIYYFIVQAYDSSGAISAPSAEVSNGGTTTPPAPTNIPVSAVTLNASVPAPEVAGTTIGWIAAATGGVPPYQFKWALFDGQAWSFLSGWSTSSIFGWTPTSANTNYAIGVWARSAWDTADAAEATSSVPYPITAPAPPPPPPPNPNESPDGTHATTVTDSLGGVWTLSPSQQTLDNVVWMGGGLGTLYAYCSHVVWVLGVNNPANPWFSWNRSQWIMQAVPADPCPTSNPPPPPAPVPPPQPAPALTGLTLTSNLAAPQVVGTKIQFTATATGGTPPYQFAWWVSDGTQIQQLAGWSTSNVFYWTPTVGNMNYQITVGARSAGSTATVPEISQAVQFPIWGFGGRPSPNQRCNGNGNTKKCQ